MSFDLDKAIDALWYGEVPEIGEARFKIQLLKELNRIANALEKLSKEGTD